MRRLEFWPDYGGVLLHENAAAVALDSLGLPADLVERAVRWVAGYDDQKLEPDTLDDAWIAEGRTLFSHLRDGLADQGTELIDWEGHWADGEASPGTW